LSEWLIKTNTLRVTPILSIKPESPTVKTFTFKDEICIKALPGQFLMLWIPGVDEIPLSISGTTQNGLISVTVAKVGEATEALHRKGKGDLIGLRGPFGKGFTLKNGKVLLVGGGTGLIPLRFLMQKLLEKEAKIHFLMGAKTKTELIFLEEIDEAIKKYGGKLLASTEDGTFGLKGMATEFLEKSLLTNEFQMVYACGPEPMLVNAFLVAEKYRMPFEASLERLMKCAIGICGSCVIGKYRVCRDGPVFGSEQLRGMKNEFGKFKRDFSGKKIPL
jgi:dihydroorotate dehydrogenase electron transfer subunit